MAGERHGRGTAWARHGNGMLYVNRPLFSIYIFFVYLIFFAALKKNEGVTLVKALYVLPTLLVYILRFLCVSYLRRLLARFPPVKSLPIILPFLQYIYAPAFIWSFIQRVNVIQNLFVHLWPSGCSAQTRLGHFALLVHVCLGAGEKMKWWAWECLGNGGHIKYIYIFFSLWFRASYSILQ